MPVIQVKAKPNARASSLTRQDDGTWLAQLKSAPVDGKANASLVAFLAEQLDVPRSQVELISGATSRQKRLRVSGASSQAIAEFLSRAEGAARSG